MPQEFENRYVIDTNIILDSVENLQLLSQNSSNSIILPETVLDEIDTKKSGFEEINFQARSFGRLLEQAQVLETWTVPSLQLNIARYFINSDKNITIDIVSKETYTSVSDADPSIRNDRKIIEIAKDMESMHGDDIKFISLDVMCRHRALSKGVKVEIFRKGNEDEPKEFIKIIDIGSDVEVSNLMNIKDFDPEYEPCNFAYDIIRNGQHFLCVVKNERIELIDEDALRKQIVPPLNKEQLFFSHALLDPYYNVVTVDAIAGSGKNLISTSAAMELIKKKQFKKIVYIRNSIESLQKGEEVGFLSTNEAKFEIYNFPLFDTLYYIANKMLKKSNSNKQPASREEISEILIEETIQGLIKEFNIQTMWPGAMRGRTISNAVVIIDEAQNMSDATMQLVMSRIDDTCKIIVIGSHGQIDNPYINRHTTGMNTLLNATCKLHDEVNLFAIRLTKVLRGPITEFAEKIYTKFKN